MSNTFINTNVSLCSPRPSSGLDPNAPLLVYSSSPYPGSDDMPLNHVLIKVDKFGFSANNVTYQALGEHPHFRYFDFHHAPSSADGKFSSKTHGLIPVWGFGIILKSTHPKIQAGERIYGYLAPTRYLLLPVSPNNVNKVVFYIPRSHLPADRRPYNQILRCASDPQYTPTSTAEDLTVLYRPLFWTSYWCEDWLNSSNYRGGAHTILISSASSKTAFCLAYVIAKRRQDVEEKSNVAPRIVGLTSRKNVGFTEKLGLYDNVVSYDSFTSTSSSSFSSAFEKTQGQRWIYVDVAGNEELNKKIYAYFASPYTAGLLATISLGMTNLSPSSSQGSMMEWSMKTLSDLSSSPSSLSSPFSDPTISSNTPSIPTSPFPPKLEQFFMPEWLSIRKHQLPTLTILARQNQAWKELMRDCLAWVELERVYGPEGVLAAYRKLAKDGLGPERGFVWSLWDEEEGGKKAGLLQRARL